MKRTSSNRMENVISHLQAQRKKRLKKIMTAFCSESVIFFRTTYAYNKSGDVKHSRGILKTSIFKTGGRNKHAYNNIH